MKFSIEKLSSEIPKDPQKSIVTIQQIVSLSWSKKAIMLVLEDEFLEMLRLTR